MENKTQIPIQIQLRTHLEQDGQIEDHRFNEPGQLIQIGTTSYLRYEEHDRETRTQTPVTFKLQEDGGIILTRGQGQLRVQFHFYLNQEVEMAYATPYGQIPLMIHTTRIDIQRADDASSGRIEVDYQLLTQQQALGKYQLRLIFQR
ncbi:DUF1934 domain-containing protein [Lapidilactobacillus concavus]|uniref:DUF1934 domain-containing protein n=1 Tax=Lapidilactobacillus concavus TaxID=287844 RepID=UPI0009FAF34E|nr:DUF1934 domain-containing protein [Lapidilactobacillus concavus]